MWKQSRSRGPEVTERMVGIAILWILQYCKSFRSIFRRSCRDHHPSMTGPEVREERGEAGASALLCSSSSSSSSATIHPRIQFHDLLLFYNHQIQEYSSKNTLLILLLQEYGSIITSSDPRIRFQTYSSMISSSSTTIRIQEYTANITGLRIRFHDHLLLCNHSPDSRIHC